MSVHCVRRAIVRESVGCVPCELSHRLGEPNGVEETAVDGLAYTAVWNALRSDALP